MFNYLLMRLIIFAFAGGAVYLLLHRLIVPFLIDSYGDLRRRGKGFRKDVESIDKRYGEEKKE